MTFSSPGPYFGYNPEIFTEVFEAGGGTVIADYNYVPIEDVDFSSQANEMANLDAPPDVVYSAMLAFQAAILRGQLDGVGVETRFLITDAFEATGGYAEGEAVEGFYHTTHSFPAAGSRVVRLDEGFEAYTGAALENPSFGGLAADAVAMVIDAFLRTGSHDPAVIGAAIAEAQGVEGVTGVLSYPSGSGSPIKPVYVHQVVDGHHPRSPQPSAESPTGDPADRRPADPQPAGRPSLSGATRRAIACRQSGTCPRSSRPPPGTGFDRCAAPNGPAPR